MPARLTAVWHKLVLPPGHTSRAVGAWYLGRRSLEREGPGRR
jgi:hypothetical protein